MVDYLHRLIVSSAPGDLVLQNGSWRWNRVLARNMQYCFLHRGFAKLGYCPDDVNFNYLRRWAVTQSMKKLVDEIIENPKNYPLYKQIVLALEKRTVPRDPPDLEKKLAETSSGFELGDSFESKMHNYFCPTGL